jgi:hypothetical protein
MGEHAQRACPRGKRDPSAPTSPGLPDSESLHECSNFLRYVFQVNIG